MANGSRRSAVGGGRRLRSGANSRRVTRDGSTAGLTRVAPRCKWASEYRRPEYALTTTCSPGYLPACARNRFAFLRAPQRPPRQPFASFSLYTYHAVVFHRRRTLLKFRFSRLRPTLPPLPLQFASNASLSLSPLPSLPRCPSLPLRTVIIKRLLFDPDLYIPFYRERKGNKWMRRYRRFKSLTR